MKVSNAAATKLFGFMPFYPRPGPRGTVPRLIFTITFGRQNLPNPDKLIEFASEINNGIPKYVLDEIVYALSRR